MEEDVSTPPTGFTRKFDDPRGWMLAEDLRYPVRMVEAGYESRIVVPFGDVLFDPVFADTVEVDGSVLVDDVGGQPRPSAFDPHQGHGAVWRLHADGRLEAVVPWGGTHRGMPMFPIRATAEFAPWEGHYFLVCQSRPGRSGAHYDHVVHRLAPGANRLELFAILPRAGTVGGGIPAAVCSSAGVGPKGSRYEGKLIVHSLMNCVLYGVDAEGVAEPVLISENSKAGVFWPTRVVFANDHFLPEYKGELIIGGARGVSFTSADETKTNSRYWGQDLEWFVVRDGDTSPEPVLRAPRWMGEPYIAPPEFGRFGGHTFYLDQGAVQQGQATKDEFTLPYDGKILRKDPASGEISVFADQVRGGFTSMAFQKGRMRVTHFGKSYSTGEFHEPDGIIFEVTSA